MKKFVFQLILSLFFASLIACNHKSNNSNNSNKNSEDYSGEINSTSDSNIDATILYDKLMTSFSNDWIERESDPDLYPGDRKSVV